MTHSIKGKDTKNETEREREREREREILGAGLHPNQFTELGS